MTSFGSPMGPPDNGSLRAVIADELQEIGVDLAVAVEDFVGDFLDTWWDAQRLVRIPTARRAPASAVSAALVALVAGAASTAGAFVNVAFDVLGAIFDLVLTVVGGALAALVAIVLGIAMRSSEVRRLVFHAIAVRAIGAGN